MKNSFETNFIPQTIEKTPFADTPAQNFFGEWCRINDSIIPQFISREEWDKRGVQGILEKNDQGKQTLFLPEDLHLWEMMDVIKIVDHDTLARKPEKREERAKKIKELGETFEKAGLYLFQYLPTLKDNQGETIAEDVASDFYQYGLLLQHKERRGDQISDTVKLSPADKAKLDEWFLGRDVYQKRISRLKEDPTEKQMEETRKKLFSVYFKALRREGHKADGEKPWEIKVGPMQHLQDRTRRQITKAIETPEREIKTAIFRRGVEKLVTEMKEVGWRKEINDLLKKVGFDPLLEQRKLYDTLDIKKLKQELDEVRKSEDIAKISAKELEIAKKIQKAVSSFPYKLGANNPSEMVETQFINCVGSSILGGGLLDEVGIKYLHADLPKHSATVLITSDGKVYWQDFTPPNGSNINYTEISSEMIEEKVDLLNVPEDGTTLRFKKWNPYSYINGNLKVTLFRPEIGLQTHVLWNLQSYFMKNGQTKESLSVLDFIEQLGGSTNISSLKSILGNTLMYLDRNEEAIVAYQRAINVDPKFAPTYYELGNALSNLDRNEEAIDAYQQAINIDPKDAYPYYGLGNALSNLDRNEEAIDAYQQAINVDPKFAPNYNGLGKALSNLGRNEEAIVAYQQFIELWNEDEYWIDRAKRIIENLEKEE